MKTSWIKRACCLAVLGMSLTACDKDSVLSEQETVVPGGEKIPKGYFQATFFPQPEGKETASRKPVQGTSTQIQSLICLIYQKQTDGTYTFYKEEKVVEYTGNVGNVTPQTYEWPLKHALQFTLPDGDYKAVFAGNVQKELFPEKNSNQAYPDGNELLTSYHAGFGDARIHMPEVGPKGFNAYNQFYLCVVDFNQHNPKPNVLLQRVVSKSVYGRSMIDANEALTGLVRHLVDQVRANDLTTEVVRALLHSSLLEVLKPLEGLTGIVTGVVDRLVNLLLGDVLKFLDELLFRKVLEALQTSLFGTAGVNESGLAQLGFLLNPLTTVNTLDLTYESMPRSIDFNRTCRSFYPKTTWKALPTEEVNNQRTCSVISLCGDAKLAEINVDKNLSEWQQLAPLLQGVDDKVLNGLLVNIHVPLAYAQQSNLQYTTGYELLNLTLSNFEPEPNKEPVDLKIKLSEVVDIGVLVNRLLGDNLITGIIGGVTDHLVQPLVDALGKVVIKGLDITLPGLNLSNIIVNGSWDATHVSDGTIAPSETGSK